MSRVEVAVRRQLERAEAEDRRLPTLVARAAVALGRDVVPHTGRDFAHAKHALSRRKTRIA